MRNLAPYGDRVKLLRAGIWSHPARLALSQQPYRGERSGWTRQVKVCGPGEDGEFDGINIGSLLASSGYDRISILKMDVEGAEAVIFSKNFDAWLERVDAIAIELHDDSMFGKGSEVFFSAINGQGFQVSRSGELTICRRSKKKESATDKNVNEEV